MSKKNIHPNSLANLIPNSQRTKEELQEMGRKGGKASGKAKRENIVTISIDTVQGERYIVRGRTPEKAAEAVGELEEELFRSWHRMHDNEGR